MLGRALSLAAVTLLIGCFAAPSAWAQAQNLEAGKSPSQLFAGTCNACHKSPRGLLKTVSAGSLPGFLRQHYTTSSDMASLLSTFLISNGASDNRNQARQGADTKPASGTDQVDRHGRYLGAPSPREAVRPDADAPAAQGRNAKRPGADGQAPAQAAIERGPDGHKLTSRQRLDKRGRPGAEESPISRDEPPKPEPAMDDKAKADTAKEEGGKPEGTKPAGEGKSEAAKVDMPKDTSVLRPDPVPPVTPAPPAAPTPPPPTSASSATPDATAARPSMRTPSEPSPSVTASAPPPAPPIAAAGPPAPPISQ